MAIYTPVIIVNSTPGIVVTMPGTLTYNEFLQSLGPDVYSINNFYIQSQTLAQIFEPIRYNAFDVNGSQYNTPLIMSVDPYQFSAAFSLSTEEKGIILNGQSSLGINLLNAENIIMIFCTDQIAATDGFDILPNGKSNFKRVDDNLGQLDLYRNFNLCLD